MVTGEEYLTTVRDMRALLGEHARDEIAGREVSLSDERG